MRSSLKLKPYLAQLLPILAFPFFFLSSERPINTENLDPTHPSELFPCKLTVTSNVLQMGETPEVSVEITNLSPSNVNFIGSLDGSDVRWRFPHCYFTIEKPREDKPESWGRCGNMNTLRPEDFIQVKRNESFNPYLSKGSSGFFSSYEIGRKANFRIPGTYRIQFHYSTLSDDIEEYLGDDYKSKRSQLKRLLQDVPKVKLESNVVVFEVKG